VVEGQVAGEVQAVVVLEEARVAGNKIVGAEAAAGNKAGAAGNRAAGATGDAIDIGAADMVATAVGDTIPGAGYVTSAIGPTPTDADWHSSSSGRSLHVTWSRRDCEIRRGPTALSARAESTF
jgi:hypothetical protein